MKKLITGLFAISLITGCATTPPSPQSQQIKTASAPSLLLELKSPVHVVRLGQRETLELKLSGSDINKMLKAREGVDANYMTPKGFSHRFDFNPQREGLFTLGPYYIEVNGQKLKSNQVTIKVLPEWDGSFGSYFGVDTDSIALGESFELLMEVWVEDYKWVNPSLAHDQSFSFSRNKVISGTSNISEDKKAYYLKFSWLITPKEAGNFQVNRDIFETFPENLQAPNFEITVTETK